MFHKTLTINNKNDKAQLQQAIIDADIQLTSAKVNLAEYLTKKYGNLPQAKPQWIEALTRMQKYNLPKLIRILAVGSVLRDLERRV